MAKQSGLGWTTLSVDNDAAAAQDIKNDITDLDISTPYNPWEVTGVDKLAVERINLLADCSGTLNAVFNPSANRAHVVLSGDLRVIRTLALTVGGKSLNNEVLFTDYNLTRAASGELTSKHPFVLADGTTPAWT